MPHVLKPDKKYTFSDYFELNCSPKELLAEFGYLFCFEPLVLPKTSRVLSVAGLLQTYTQKLPCISLTSETAKREFYISPLLLELLNYILAEINVEYPLDAGENLSARLIICCAMQQVIQLLLRLKKEIWKKDSRSLRLNWSLLTNRLNPLSSSFTER